MEIVNLMYRYINKFINSDELIKELEKIDLTKYSKKEIKDINQLIFDVKKIKDNVPNELDEVEQNRISEIEHILEALKMAKTSDKMDNEAKEFIDRQYNQLLKDKEIIRDGGKLYEDLFELLTNNALINKYASKMNNKELLEFITKYISAPMPPNITQEEFNDLVSVGIREDKREALWRLAFNYNKKNMDFSIIEDYFIEKRDDYYLVELVCAVQEDLNIKNLIAKVISTEDKKFINNSFERAKDIGLITDEEIKKLLKMEEDIKDE